MNIESISFPEKYKPSKSAVFVRNEISINARKEDIWFWLTNATTWPEWYPNASNVKILDQKDNYLSDGSQFKWRTFNTNIESKVVEFKPCHRLAWVAKGYGLLAYHAWLIIPTVDGYKVITEETQQGWLPTIAKWFIKKGLKKQHQIWLEGLKEKAETYNTHAVEV